MDVSTSFFLAELTAYLRLWIVDLLQILFVGIPAVYILVPLVRKRWNAPDKKKAQDQETP